MNDDSTRGRPEPRRTAAAVARLLGEFVGKYRLGVVVRGEGWFRLPAGAEREGFQDIAFISNASLTYPIMSVPVKVRRLEAERALPPDLLVHVMAPAEIPDEVMAQAEEWSASGARLVWVVDPGSRVAHVIRGEATIVYQAEAPGLDGENVLPGFTCPFEEIF